VNVDMTHGSGGVIGVGGHC